MKRAYVSKKLSINVRSKLYRVIFPLPYKMITHTVKKEVLARLYITLVSKNLDFLLNGPTNYSIAQFDENKMSNMVAKIDVLNAKGYEFYCLDYDDKKFTFYPIQEADDLEELITERSKDGLEFEIHGPFSADFMSKVVIYLGGMDLLNDVCFLASPVYL